MANSDDDRWFELMLNLYEHRNELVSDFMNHVVEIPGYANSEVSMSDMRETAVNAYNAILRKIIDNPSGIDQRIFLAKKLGSLRAQQGIPLPDLTTAISLDFKIIWRLLMRLVKPSDAALLANHVESVWNAVDGFSQATQIEYHNESVRMEGSQFTERALKLENFINSTDVSENEALIVSQSFSIPIYSTYVVCYGNSVPTFSTALREIRSYSKRVMLYQHEAETWNLFWPSTVPDGQGHPLRALANIPCGYMPDVRNLIQVPRALRTLKHYMLTINQSNLASPVNVNSNWAPYAGTVLFTTFPELLDLYTTYLEYMNEMSPKEQEELKKTIATFLQTGSVQLTSRACFCHRNTVMKRINAFEKATYLDLRNPTDLAFAVLLIKYLHNVRKW
ncbi:helix-turn-helix domain-containing protein [Bifidobacterium aquikefiricola]|uniref:Helix-turn-helix domain-containing protein n=1 Tax=Bifidobacterium aquikefiricola TaxID=3059038 RepID=A0AB39U5G3_9BIFI